MPPQPMRVRCAVRVGDRFLLYRSRGSSSCLTWIKGVPHPTTFGLQFKRKENRRRRLKSLILRRLEQVLEISGDHVRLGEPSNTCSAS